MASQITSGEKRGLILFAILLLALFFWYASSGGYFSRADADEAEIEVSADSVAEPVDSVPGLSGSIGHDETIGSEKTSLEKHSSSDKNGSKGKKKSSSKSPKSYTLRPSPLDEPVN